MNVTLIERRNSDFVQRGSRERRTALFPHFRYWGRRGRRCRIRRYSDRTGTYLDWHPTALLWVVAAALGLCAADAAFTLLLLQRGAVEINPFMAVLIDINLTLFVGVKMALTASGLICLVIYQNFTVLGIFRVRQLIYVSLGLYVGTVLYEGGLLLAEPFISP